MIFAWLKDKVPRVSYLKKRMNDEVLIISANNLAIYYLNQTAAFFVNLADGTNTIDDIKRKFQEAYDVSEDVLEKDFIEMIRDLQWKKILVLEDK